MPCCHWATSWFDIVPTIKRLQPLQGVSTENTMQAMPVRWLYGPSGPRVTWALGLLVCQDFLVPGLLSFPPSPIWMDLLIPQGLVASLYPLPILLDAFSRSTHL